MLEEKKLDEAQEGLSRRNFLVKAGVVTAGLAVTGSVLGSLAASDAQAAAALPWPYKKLDLDTVRKRGFEGYIVAGCCYGAASALLNTLKDTVGTPWDTVPIDMFRYGAGGAHSWGTLCGALNGALYVIQMVGGAKADTIGNELIGWYTKNSFPTSRLDSWVANDPRYNGQTPKKDANGVVTDTCDYRYVTTRTVAKSPLCHESVSIWIAESNKGRTTGLATVGGNEKKARCGKLTGDVAAKTAELLNKYHITGAFAAGTAFAQYADADFCMSCHWAASSTTPPTNTLYPLDNEQGKMKCGECHDESYHNHTDVAADNECGTCHK